MENNEIDNIFRAAFDKAEEHPSPMIWDNIADQLDQKTAEVPVKKTHWYKYAAAATILVTLGFTLQLFLRQQRQTTISNDIAQQTVPMQQENVIDSMMNNERSSPIIQPHRPKNIQVAKRQKKKQQSKYLSRDEPQATEDYSEILVHLTMASIQKSNLQIANPTNLPTISVTEVDPIKPLIENPEETESMYASTVPNTVNNNIVTSVLNKITENIDINDTRNIRFSADEEGSFRVNIINSFAKNRLKKRK